MKKLIRPSEKILLFLAFLGDFYTVAYSRSHGFGLNKSLFEALDIKNTAFRQAVWRFLKTGEIEKIVDKQGRACLRLSAPGIDRIERIFPLYRLASRPWDGKWRIVVFDIAEKEHRLRDYLREKLVSLGFGKLQESVYITPLDVLADLKEFLKEAGLYGQAIVFEAMELFSPNPKVIANYVWRLDEINERYRKLTERVEEIKGEGEDKSKIKKIKEDFFSLLLKDPILPKEFLSEDWEGEETRKIILSL